MKNNNKKKGNLFPNTLITIYFRTPAVTFQDWSSYNLTFRGIRFFFFFFFATPQYPHYARVC